MAFLKSTIVSGNLFVTSSENYVSASEFRGPLTGTASYATEAAEAVTASHALDINPSADITVHNFTASGDAQVNGNLTVKGDLVYVGTSDLRVKDKYIELNVAPSGTTPVSADGAGIVIRNSEGRTGEDAAMVYDGTKDVLYFTKPISGSVDVVVDSASFADEANSAVSAALAEQAKKVLHDLNVGSGFATTGSYNGSADFNLTIDQDYIKNIKSENAHIADTASVAEKVAEQLSVSDAQGKNRISGGPYNGSSAVTISLDLSDIDTAVSGAQAAADAAQADVDALETLVGTIPAGGAATVTAYAKQVAESASAALDVESKLTGVLASASKAQETANAATESAATNAAAIQQLQNATSSYVTDVAEGTSTENFVALTVDNSTKNVKVSIDDSALNTKIGALETADTNILASASEAKTAASAAQATADEALASGSATAQALADLNASEVAATAPSGSSWTNVQEAINVLDGRTAAGGVTVEKKETAESGFAASYIVKQGGQQVGDTINIPKDYLVKSGEVKTCTVADDPVQGLVPGDKYLDFVVNTKDGEESQTASHIYIPVKELTDVYTGATTDEIAVTVDAGNHISGSIVAVNGSKLVDGTVTKAKLADAVTASLDKADSALQKADITTGTASGSIKVKGTDVQVAGLGSAAYEEATAFDASGAAAAVSTSLSTSLATEVSRSTAAETALSQRIDTVTGSMTTIATASGEKYLTLTKTDNNYTIGTKDLASSADLETLTTSFNSYTQSANGRLDNLETASASLHTEVANAQATASEALATASAASASIAAEVTRATNAEQALSSSLSASIAEAEDKYVNVDGDRMTGQLKFAGSNAEIFMEKPTGGVSNVGFHIRYNSADDAIEFVFDDSHGVA